MVHPDIMRLMAHERFLTLQEAARPVPHAHTTTRPLDLSGIELRLCRIGDDPQLAELAQLAERPLPAGRFVVAAVAGRIVAALPLAGGAVLADPFVRTTHRVPLLELRAAQLRGPEPRRRAWPHAAVRYVSLIRGSTHA